MATQHAPASKHTKGECCVCMETKQLVQTCAGHVGQACKSCLLHPTVHTCPVCRARLPSKADITRGLFAVTAAPKRPRAPEPIREQGPQVVIRIYNDDNEARRIRRRSNESMHQNLEAAARVQHQDEIMARNLQDRFDREQPAEVQIREDEEVARQLQRDQEGSDEDSEDSVEPVLPPRRVLRFCSCNNPGCPWRGFNPNN